MTYPIISFVLIYVVWLSNIASMMIMKTILILTGSVMFLRCGMHNGIPRQQGLRNQLLENAQFGRSSVCPYIHCHYVLDVTHTLSRGTQKNRGGSKNESKTSICFKSWDCQQNRILWLNVSFFYFFSEWFSNNMKSYYERSFKDNKNYNKKYYEACKPAELAGITTLLDLTQRRSTLKFSNIFYLWSYMFTQCILTYVYHINKYEHCLIVYFMDRKTMQWGHVSFVLPIRICFGSRRLP